MFAGETSHALPWSRSVFSTRSSPDSGSGRLVIAPGRVVSWDRRASSSSPVASNSLIGQASDSRQVGGPRQPDSESLNQPFCKICLGTGNLMERYVCACRGSVGFICNECLFTVCQKGLQRAGGFPVCADCHQVYRGLEYVFSQSPITFHEWLRTYGNVSLHEEVGLMFACPLLVFVSFWFAFLPVRAFDYIPHRQPIGGVMGLIFCLGTIFSWYIMFGYYQRFSRRPETDVTSVRFSDEGPAPSHHTTIDMPDYDIDEPD